MTTASTPIAPEPAPEVESTPKMSAAQRFSRVRAFATAPEAGPSRLGFCGAVLITAGGLGAGSTRQHDPVLESIHMSWLRFGHGLVLSSILLWTGVGLMLIAWVRLGRRGLLGSTTGVLVRGPPALLLVALLVFGPPFS